MVLAIGAALVAALVVRQSTSISSARRLALVAAVALVLRTLALTAIYLVAIRVHAEGNWLNDEASFYLATEALLWHGFDSPLPNGLDHLGGDTFLGLLTALTLAVGHMDTVGFRMLNATLGTLVAVITALTTRALVGDKAAVLAGLLVAVWPTLVLWSATFLRDTLGSFLVVLVWWTLVRYRRLTDPRVLSTVILVLLMVDALRPYLAAAIAVGVVAWAVYPLVRRTSRPVVLASSCALVVLGVLVGTRQQQRIDDAAHELVYRQTTTRMETLGRLYTDVTPDTPPQEPPFGPGAAVAIAQPGTTWILPGVVQVPAGPGLVVVGFVDGSVQTDRIADLMLLRQAPLSPVQVAMSVWPGLVSFVSGISPASDSPLWTADALAWDVLFLLAIIGGLRAGVPVRDWLFPACVVFGTMAALIAVPGALGNDDRHRSSQAVPLLVVFAAGWLASRRSPRTPGLAVVTATSKPISAGTAAASRSRSLRYDS